VTALPALLLAAAAAAPCAAPGPGCACLDRWAGPGTLPFSASEKARPACFPAFDGAAAPLDAQRRARMKGVSWHPGCPVALDALALLDLPIWTLEGKVSRGRIVVAATAAPVVLQAMRAFYEMRFPFERMEPVEAFGGDDGRSMEAGNTTGFNCRKAAAAGRRGWSRHALGIAVDVNPRLNPFVQDGVVRPASGKAFADRARIGPGMLVRDGPAVQAWRALGWMWGGRWRFYQDYQHFSADGR